MKSMAFAFEEELASRVHAAGVMAVLVVDDAADAVPLAEAVLAGGIGIMELALRTPVAMEALLRIRQAVPEMVAGVGTVLLPEQVRAAQAAGAAFGVAPGTNARVLKAARAAGFSFAPGIATPSDIELALEFDCRLMKFFPAEPSGGLRYLRSIAGPYAHLGLRYIPLGGVDETNLGTYLSEPLIGAVGGSWLAPRELIRSRDWAAITKRCAAAMEVFESRRTRQEGER